LRLLHQGDAKAVDEWVTRFNRGDLRDRGHETDSRGRTALHIAVERGHDEVVRTLIKHDMILSQPATKVTFFASSCATILSWPSSAAMCSGVKLAQYDRTQDGFTALPWVVMLPLWNN